MIWNKVLVNKIKAVAAVILVFLLVLATNMMDNHHFDVVKRTLKTVYEDRLVVKDYIYKMSDQLNRKQLALLTGDSVRIQRVNAVANDSLQALLNRYSTTRLTTSEARKFNELQENLSALMKNENDWSSENPSGNEVIYSLYENIEDNLDTLFEIQLVEGKRQIDTSNRAIANSDFISKIEMGVLIVLGLIIQIIILYKAPST